MKTPEKNSFLLLTKFRRVKDISKSSKDFNDKITSDTESQLWNRVYEDFVQSSSKLVEAYKKLPASLWDKQIWPDKQMTPKEYIQLEINHYSKEHLPQIRELINAS